MLNYILVGVGSAIGGVSRFWASGVIASRFGQSFLPVLDEMMGGGLVTLEKARVIDWGGRCFLVCIVSGWPWFA